MVKIDARKALLVTRHYYAKSSLRRVIRVVVRHCFATGTRSPDNSAIFDSENHCNPLCTIIQVPWIRWLLSGRMYHHLCYTTAVFTATLSMHTTEKDMSYTIHNLALYSPIIYSLNILQIYYKLESANENANYENYTQINIFLLYNLLFYHFIIITSFFIYNFLIYMYTYRHACISIINFEKNSYQFVNVYIYVYMYVYVYKYIYIKKLLIVTLRINNYLF